MTYLIAPLGARFRKKSIETYTFSLKFVFFETKGARFVVENTSRMFSNAVLRLFLPQTPVQRGKGCEEVMTV